LYDRLEATEATRALDINVVVNAVVVVVVCAL
jgi:hypothetical protein